MKDFLEPILEVMKFIGGPALKYLNYHKNFNTYVDDFRKAQKDLHSRKADNQQQLEEELRFGKRPKLEVENWFNSAEEKISRAHGVQDKLSREKYIFRSFLGKVVDEMTQEIREVYDKGQFTYGMVVNDPSTKNLKLPTEELVGATKVEEVYQYLMGDGVRKIGVCGMGGIGKTTVMKHVYNKLLDETKFNKLIWTTVSQSFDIRRLQQEIACQLNEKLSEVESTPIRAGKLSEMLRKHGRYVLILDDVWSSFSLKEVGILEPTVDNGCKLAFTTRLEEVVRSMHCTKVTVTCLSKDEALQLFLSKVGEDMLPNPTLESIVAECDGLPLAIVTVAGCMRGVSNPFVWENALNELRGCIRNIRGVEDKVFVCLKFSCDRLQQINRDCFLYCALYPEDYKIEKEEIIEYWMEEGLIHEMGTDKAMKGSGYSVLQCLEENCLLERVGEGRRIKMHDVVRDMVLHITRKRFMVKAGKQLEEIPNEEEWTEDLEKVSLMCNSISTIPSSMKFPKFQKLTTLLLPRNRLKKISESFFNHTPNLKILDLSNNPIVNLPNSISNLEKLTALLLHCCYNLYDLPSLSRLQALKKLDLESTKICETPKGLQMLVNLRYLNLKYTEHLQEIPHGFLSKLCLLRYLAIHPAVTRAEEMREMSKLEVFEGYFSDIQDLIMFGGQRKRLQKYLIWVSHEFIDPFFYEYKDYSKRLGFGSIDMNCGDGIILPFDIQFVRFTKCKGMRSLNNIRGWENVTDLKKCIVKECDELESIVLSKCPQLETLEFLLLLHLSNLKGIVGECTFSSLKYISLDSCGKIKNVLSARWVLHYLEVIRVEDCHEIEDIIEPEEERMGTIKYTLPKLKTLELRNLAKLKSICSRNGELVCDSIQHMHIEDCPKLKRIPLYLPLLDLDKGKPSPPPSLKKIIVEPKERWESLEWDHPDAKHVLLPFLNFISNAMIREGNDQWQQAV